MERSNVHAHLSILGTMLRELNFIFLRSQSVYPFIHLSVCPTIHPLNWMMTYKICCYAHDSDILECIFSRNKYLLVCSPVKLLNNNLCTCISLIKLSFKLKTIIRIKMPEAIFDIIIKSFMALLKLCKIPASYIDKREKYFSRYKLNNQTSTNLNMLKIKKCS